MNTNNNQSIIYNLTVSQVDDLIIEHDLVNKYNYNFNYIIDPYDLSKYCFPFGIVKSSEDTNIQRLKMSTLEVSDEQIAYDHIFVKDDSRLFILDEHFREVIDFQSYYKFIQSKHGSELINTAKVLAEYYEKKATDEEQIKTFEDINPDSISLLYSIAINSVSLGRDKFNNLIRDKKIIASFRQLEEIDLLNKEQIKEFFIKCRPSKLGETLLDLAKRFYLPESQSNNLRAKIHVKNLERDYKAIDRILSLNKQLLKYFKSDNKNNKSLFLYLSNTRMSKVYFQDDEITSKNEGMVSFLKDINKLIRCEFPKFENKKFNPHRTPAQIYLRLLLEKSKLSGQEVDVYVETKKRLSYFRDYIANPNINNHDEEVIVCIKDLNDIINRYRNNFDGYLLLEKHKEFNNDLTKALKNKSLRSYKKVLNNIKSIQDFLNDNQLTRELDKYINSSFWIISLSQIIRKFLNSLNSESSSSPVINLRGSDRISNIFQAIPIVFFNSDKKHTFCFELLNDFIKNIIKPSINKVDIVDNIIKKIDNFEKFKTLFAVDCIEDTATIMNILILLLLNKGSSTLQINPNSLAIRLIDYNSKKKFDDIEHNEISTSNYLYLEAWAMRRNNKLDKSKNITGKGMERFPKDPRFVHSKALLEYCEFYNENNKSKKMDLILSSISSFKKALTMYDKINSSEIDECILMRTKQSIINSISYSYVIASKYEPNKSYLRKARYQLEKLKSLIDEKEYDTIAEFLHTESFLEQHESMDYQLKNNFEMAIYKAGQALNEIKKTIQVSNRTKSKHYYKLKEHILLLLEELKNS